MSKDTSLIMIYTPHIALRALDLPSLQSSLIHVLSDPDVLYVAHSSSSLNECSGELLSSDIHRYHSHAQLSHKSYCRLCFTTSLFGQYNFSLKSLSWNYYLKLKLDIL